MIICMYKSKFVLDNLKSGLKLKIIIFEVSRHFERFKIVFVHINIYIYMYMLKVNYVCIKLYSQIFVKSY